MDRSFIITGFSKEGDAVKPVAGVLFVNKPLAPDAINALGFYDIQSVSEVKPASAQPTEPTLYIFQRSPSAIAVEIVRLDWNGAESSRGRASGEPCSLIPPVTGEAAESVLYAPKAFVISAQVKECGMRAKPVVAVLFVKPVAGQICPDVDKKMLNRLGLVDLQTVERVQVGGKIAESALYVFERTPAASSVSVSRIGRDGSLISKLEVKGEPASIIPAVIGSAADRFVNPRGAPSASDFPKAAELAPSSRSGQGRQQRHRR